MLEANRDITKRRQAEDALRSSQARLRLALEAAKSGTWEWDLATNENFWSEEVWPLYGLKPHAVKPSYHAWLQVLHPDDRAMASDVVTAAARRGSELNVEFRVVHPDNSQRWLMARGHPERDSAGQPARFIGIVVDITERKQIENERELLATAIEQAAETVVVTDRAGTIQYVNPGFHPHHRLHP